MHQLEQLLDIHGVSSSYWNYKGEHVDVPFQNRVGLLRAIYASQSIDFTDKHVVTDILNNHHLALTSNTLPPLSITQFNSSFVDLTIDISQLDSSFQIKVVDNSGNFIFSDNVKINALEEVAKRSILDRLFSVRRCPIQNLPVGYYSIEINGCHKSGLAVCPSSCYTPDWMLNGDKQTGVIVQLYSLKSHSNMGIGDFDDLMFLINKLADNGFSSIGLNPLHALLPNLNENYSPYSPSDRRFISFLYLSIKSCPEYDEVTLNLNPQNKAKYEKQLVKLREDDFIDYTEVKKVKFDYIEKMYHIFSIGHSKSHRQDEFKAFVSKGGDDLIRYCLLDALSHNSDHKQACNLFSQSLLNSDMHEKLLRDNKKLIDIYLYAQWLTVMQFASAQSLAVKRGMTIGLVNDLAVGADKMGSEVLTNRRLFCVDAAVGAPPDEIAPIGQNWGLPPLDPLALKQSGYEHFIRLLRANMSNCGALRIDHVMGLTRLWWCPPGATADQGAYIHYPFHEILNLLKLESHLNQCAIIGEDLGIVPENFRETLRAANVLSNKVMYFEREGQATFKHPAQYDRFALAMINNHDVPTLASWWNGDDIALRQKLNAIEVGKTAEQLRDVRADEKANLVSHLVYGDHYPSEWQNKNLDAKADQSLVFAIIEWAAQAQSILFVVQLEDLLLMTAPVNVPGTFREYPNWKRKLTHNLEDIFNRPDVNHLLTTISTKRRSS